MPVDLSIVESTTELGQTVVEVVLESASTPGPQGAAGAAGVTDADFLVGTAHAGLSAEIVVGTTPGGELGGTWASPTVDASHSGSTHAAVQAAAEATAAAALATHTADTTAVHGIADTSALALTADLTAHTGDTTDAHDASAISVVPFGTIAATDVQAALEEVVAEASSGAPTNADYLVGTANASLSNEIVVGTTPGGELGGTWASPTVDASHSGSTHAAVQAAAEATAAAALATHEADTTSVHGIADTSALALTANVVTKALYDANTVLKADSDDTPTALTMGASTILARLAAGSIKAATPAELRTLLDVPTNAEAVLDTLYDANTVLAADSDNTPAPVTMGASTILARLAAGNIKAASVAEILTLLDVPTNAQAILDAIMDAKGDLIVASAADTPARLAVGTNGHVLTADSAEATGVKWAAAAGGGGASADDESLIIHMEVFA